TRFRPDVDYLRWSGPDDVPGEGKGHAQGIAFPHPTTGGKPKLGPKYYEALANSPFGNELLLAFAKQCVEAEKLGTRGAPDPRVVKASGQPREVVAAEAAKFLAAQSGVSRTFTREQLAGPFPESDVVGTLMKRSYYPGRCGDVGVVLKPYCLPSKRLDPGTTH